MARLTPRYLPRHHYIIHRALSRREVNPTYYWRFLQLLDPQTFAIGVTHIMADTRIDVSKLVEIANRIGAAEDGMDKAQAALMSAQARKDTAQADAAALIAKAAQDVTDAQAAQAQASGEYKSANADLISFVQALDVPPDPAAPPVTGQ